MKQLFYTIRFLVCVCVFSFAAFGQTDATPTPSPKAEPSEYANFRYSKNPPAKSTPKPRKRVIAEKAKSDSKVDPKSNVASTEETNQGAKVEKSSADIDGSGPDKTDTKPVYESVAKTTRAIAKQESDKNIAPTDTYKVGIGDVLFISLQESKSSYYTVLNDGSIDYPLAGGLVLVAGLTVEGIEETLRQQISLYENPEVSVKVREHASHAIDVLGMVGKPGKQYLQREAMPLYVIRAQAIAQTTADLVVIKRKDTDELLLRAGTPEYDETLIYPNDVVEFTSANSRGATNGFVYIGGNVGDIGRFGFSKGMTLTQAILAAGGLSDEKTKKALIRRKDEKGFLKTKSYKLSDIKKGKLVDPELEAGDIIEVGK